MMALEVFRKEAYTSGCDANVDLADGRCRQRELGRFATATGSAPHCRHDQRDGRAFYCHQYGTSGI